MSRVNQKKERKGWYCKRTASDTVAEKRVLGKMLEKVLVPYIYRNRVWCLDETRWPISFAEFVGLNEQLLTKFAEIHASHQWQAIIQYYEDIKQELQSLED